MRHAELMADEYPNHLRDHHGLVLLRAVHASGSPDRQAGLQSFTVMRWEDQHGVLGQDSTARIVNYLKNGGQFGIEVEGEVRPVVVSSSGNFLITQDAEPTEDPILTLPTFDGH
jgi:hypothetical protein